MKNKDIHLEILKLTVQALGELTEKLVFLGGSTISLYITEPEVVQIRETLDVDCVVEVSSRLEYEELIQKLRQKGFSEDIATCMVCATKIRANRRIRLGFLFRKTFEFNESYDSQSQ